jgi:hypothetical protein
MLICRDGIKKFRGIKGFNESSRERKKNILSAERRREGRTEFKKNNYVTPCQNIPANVSCCRENVFSEYFGTASTWNKMSPFSLNTR